MIKRIITSTIILILLLQTNVYAMNFNFRAGIENTGTKKYKAIKLTPSIYNNAKGNLADIMLYDKNNEAVPYFINSFTESETETKKSYEMKMINSFIKDEFFYYDYTLKNPLNEDVLATSIELQSDKEGFAKKVEIYGGYDNINWEKVQDDILYNVGGNKKPEIAFNSVKKYTYYRFKIPNNLEKVSFSSVMLKYSNTLQNKEYFMGSVSPEFIVEEKGNQTIIKVKHLKNLKLNSITLKTDSVFKRNVSVNGDGRMTKMLYNLEFENTRYQDLTIPLGFYKVSSDDLEIAVDNKDDKPINILGIEVKYLVDELVFDGSKSWEYTLKYGNSELENPKSYDISNYRDQILKDGYDVLSIKNTIVNSYTSPVKSQTDYKLILNITVSLVAVVMGVIVFLKLKK